MNQEGLMWRGTHNTQKEVMWKFGQFQKNMLESSFYLLLQIRRLPIIHCNDPVKVSRNLSAAVSKVTGGQNTRAGLKVSFYIFFCSQQKMKEQVEQRKLLFEYIGNKVKLHNTFSSNFKTICS